MPGHLLRSQDDETTVKPIQNPDRLVASGSDQGFNQLVDGLGPGP